MNKYCSYLLFSCLVSCNVKQEGNKELDYIYKGEEKSTHFQIDDSIVSSSKLDFDIVSTPLMASKIAYIVISEVYGEEVAKNEKPYNIILLNGNCWLVCGTARQGNEGGTFTVYIGKENARIYRIWHDK